MVWELSSDWEEDLKGAIQSAGPQGFAYARALEEIASLRRALRAANDRIREIQEFVGRPEEN